MSDDHPILRPVECYYDVPYEFKKKILMIVVDLILMG